MSMVLLVASLFGQVDLFVSSHYKSPSEVLAFWGGELVQLRVMSNQRLELPTVHVLSQALAAPVELADVQFQSCQLEDGLYQHDFQFSCPEARGQLRYRMRFNGVAGAVLFDAYPQWLRTQTARQAEAFSISIQPEHPGADSFFDALGVAIGVKRRTSLRIKHSPHELLIERPGQRFIWKTDCDALNLDNPRSVLDFSQVLETILKTNEN
jgi:hypothetical protein